MIGTTVSHYKILEQIGQGGMGVVYKAHDTKLDRIVALKFLPPHASHDAARFQQEAKAAAALNHPNICTIYEIDESEEQTYISFEYIEGETLKDTMSGGALAIERAVDIAVQICEGLKEAHERGIVHRDIKPANIMITAKDRVKIMDFGLAKTRTASDATREGTTLGTVAYMSPEQARGQAVDPRTDIWSLGVLLFEMLAGERPFKGDYEQAVIYSILNEPVSPVHELRKEIPAPVSRAVCKCLQKDPDSRFQNIEAVASSLLQRAGEPLKDYKAAAPRSKKRSLTLWGIPIILLILLAVLMRAFGLFPGGVVSENYDSIAVLPLQNLSGNPEQDYFADGMTEALITELSKIKKLNVISRTSVMRYKETTKSLPQIGRELGVDAIVEGSALLAGDQVRITAQLVDARKDRHLWANNYQREFKQVLNLQQEVALAIANEIRISLSPGEMTRLTREQEIDPLAQEYYLKGKYYIAQTSREASLQALDYFSKALEIDSNYAPALAGIAYAYDNLTALGYFDDAKGWPLVKKYAQKALRLDPTLAEAHTMLADVKYIMEWDWKGAEAAFKRAIELNPSYSNAHSWYAVYLLTMRRFEEALGEAERSVLLDPYYAGAHINYAYVSYIAGGNEHTRKVIERAWEMNVDYPVLDYLSGFIELRESKQRDGMEKIRRALETYARTDQDSSRIYRIQSSVYYYTRDADSAKKLLEKLLRSGTIDPTLEEALVRLYTTLGDYDAAFGWLEHAFQKHRHFLSGLPYTPELKPLRSDPRYASLLRNMGLKP